MKELPFTLDYELPGWELCWAFVEVVRNDEAGIGALRAAVAERARARFPETSAIAAHPGIAAMRRLFKAAGCDPTRYRPAAEALVRRLIKGSELPAIHPLVDVNNCLSVDMLVPCCVMAEGSFGQRLCFRRGQPGESYLSLRGPFNLEAKPLLVDENGALDTPITGNTKVAVEQETMRAWLVAYLPQHEVSAESTWLWLADNQEQAGVRVHPGVLTTS